MEWHRKLSTRGKIVDRGEVEVESAFGWAIIYHVTPLKMSYLCILLFWNFQFLQQISRLIEQLYTVWQCNVTLKIVD